MGTIVIDTSVIVGNPNVFYCFPGEKIVIPMVVLEELDGLKKSPGAAGYGAREAIRQLDNICNNGMLATGVSMENGSVIKVEDSRREDTNDNAIILAAHRISNTDRVTLLSNDINMRVKANALGINAESVSNDNVSSGHSVITIVSSELSLFFDQGWLNFVDKGLYENEYVTLMGTEGGSGLGRYTNGRVVLVKPQEAWCVKPQNREQTFAFDALLNRSIPLVILTGIAGVGKTHLALAAALAQSLDVSIYDRIILTRPMEPVGGKQIGFLPGEKNEKIMPWMAGFMDNLELLVRDRDTVDMYIEEGNIGLEALTFMRGRTFMNDFVIVDEAENLTREEIKVIVTRIGRNAKLVLSGDISQVDRPNVSSDDNGLTYVIDKFRETELAAHIELTEHKKSRSPLATLAANIL